MEHAQIVAQKSSPLPEQGGVRHINRRDHPVPEIKEWGAWEEIFVELEYQHRQQNH